MHGGRQGAGLERASVLLVAPASDYREKLAGQLEALGARLTVRAIDQLLNPEPATPDMILVDTFHPGHRGPSAVTAVRQARSLREVPLLAIAPDGATREMPDELLDAGFDDVVFHPGSRHFVTRLALHLDLLGDRWTSSLEHDNRDVLLAVYDALHRSSEPEEFLDDVVQAVSHYIPAYRCGVILFDSGSGDGIIAASADDPAMRGFVLSAERYPELVKMRNMAETVRIEDPYKSPVTESVRELLSKVGAGASLAVPIRTDTHVLGALFLRAAPDESGFTDGDARLLERIAEIMSSPLAQAETLARLRSERDRESRKLEGMEERLENTELLRNLFDRIPIGLANLDRDGRFTFVNRACSKILARPREDLLGLDFMDLVQFSEQPRGARIAKAGRARRARIEDLTVSTESAGNRLIEFVANPMPRDEDGQILVLRDVTEERRQGREVERTRDFLQSIIQNSSDAIAAAGIDGRLLLVNRAAEALFGYSSRELINTDVRKLYPAGGAQQVMRSIRSDRHGGRGRALGLRVVVKDRSGEEIPVGMSAAMLFEDGREFASVGIFHDLRPRQAIEEALREATKRIGVLERSTALAHVAADALPRLQETVRGIRGAVKSLDDPETGEAERAAQLAMLAEQAELLGSMARGLENAWRLREDARRDEPAELNTADRPSVG